MACPDANMLQAFFGGGATLEEREAVRAHLPTCAACRDVVLALAPTPQPRPDGEAPTPVPPRSRSELARGQSVDRYVIAERLGAGGMGVVYRAYDPELDRKVALKLIRRAPGPDDDRTIRELQERLLREAQAMARITHPNVIAVYDVGRHGDDVFVAMELVDGETLAMWLTKAHTPSEIARIFVRAGRGLAAAHAAGLVHRDFKPNNVMIGHDGRVRVLDFGLARPVGALSDSAPSSPSRLYEPLTQSGVFAGTPAYMAPEQLACEPTNAATDQFSFCVALYEGLAGVRPFAGSSTDELRAAIVARKITRPLRRVPARLARAVERGLRAVPSERWPSMDALVAELGRNPARRAFQVAGLLLATSAVVAGGLEYRHVRARCTGFGREVDAFWNSASRDAMGRAFAATKLPYAATAVTSVDASLDRYRQSWVDARTQACRDEQKGGPQAAALYGVRTECLDNHLGSMRQLVDRLGDADAAVLSTAVGTAAALNPIAECADGDALLRRAQPILAPTDEAGRQKVAALNQRARAVEALFSKGMYKDALPLATALRQDAATIDFADLMGRAAYWEAGSYHELGKLQEAERSFKEAALDFTRARDDEQAARSWANMAFVIGNDEGRPEEGLEWIRLAEAEFARRQAGDYGEKWLAEHAMPLLQATGHYAEARAAAEKGLALTRKTEPPDSPNLIIPLAQLAWVLSAQNHPDQAIPIEEEALADTERLLGTDHPQAILITNNLISCLLGADRPAEALALIQKNWDRFPRALVGANASIPYQVRADALAALHRCDEALPDYRQSVAILEKTLPHHPRMTGPLGGLGKCELELGHAAAALAPLERALAILDANHVPPADFAATRFTLARALWPTGQRARARQLAQWADDAYAEQQKRTGGEYIKLRGETKTWLDAHPL